MTDFDVILPPGRGKIQIAALKEVMLIREQMQIHFLWGLINSFKQYVPQHVGPWAAK